MDTILTRKGTRMNRVDGPRGSAAGAVHPCFLSLLPSLALLQSVFLAVNSCRPDFLSFFPFVRPALSVLPSVLPFPSFLLTCGVCFSSVLSYGPSCYRFWPYSLALFFPSLLAAHLSSLCSLLSFDGAFPLFFLYCLATLPLCSDNRSNLPPLTLPSTFHPTQQSRFEAPFAAPEAIFSRLPASLPQILSCPLTSDLGKQVASWIQ